MKENLILYRQNNGNNGGGRFADLSLKIIKARQQRQNSDWAPSVTVNAVDPNDPIKKLDQISSGEIVVDEITEEEVQELDHLLDDYLSNPRKVVPELIETLRELPVMRQELARRICYKEIFFKTKGLKRRDLEPLNDLLMPHIDHWDQVRKEESRKRRKKDGNGGKRKTPHQRQRSQRAEEIAETRRIKTRAKRRAIKGQLRQGTGKIR